MEQIGIFNRIVNFNKQRNIPKSFKTWIEYENMKEELTELVDAENDSESVDALADIIVFAVGAMWKLGYEPEKVMHETLLEIEDREQDPKQYAKWLEDGPSGKWLKNKEQVDPYKACYNSCKEDIYS